MDPVLAKKDMTDLKNSALLSLQELTWQSLKTSKYGVLKKQLAYGITAFSAPCLHKQMPVWTLTSSRNQATKIYLLGSNKNNKMTEEKILQYASL